MKYAHACRSMRKTTNLAWKIHQSTYPHGLQAQRESIANRTTTPKNTYKPCSQIESDHKYLIWIRVLRINKLFHYRDFLRLLTLISLTLTQSISAKHQNFPSYVDSDLHHGNEYYYNGRNHCLLPYRKFGSHTHTYSMKRIHQSRKSYAIVPVRAIRHPPGYGQHTVFVSV